MVQRKFFAAPSVDVLFHPIASVFGAQALAVVLTGMAQDGLKGCEALRAAGARVSVQHESSGVVWGTPDFVARSGLADKILPLDKLAGRLFARPPCKSPRELNLVMWPRS
jgi:two-component system, chemotaxis family, protein-glutamate methylesterase/glutaminase